MSKYTRRLGAPIVVAAVLLAACSSDAKKGPDSTALGADTTLSRDLALANHDSAAQPALNDVPSAPAKSTPAPSKPAPKPAAPKPASSTTKSGNTATTTPGSTGGGAVGTIAAGSSINASSAANVCTNTNSVGDHITATVDNAVAGSNGAAIPAGATLNLTVTQLKRSENANDKIIMEFAVNSVTYGGHTYPLDATVASAAVTRVRDEPKSKDVQKVAIGAVAGAIAGKILGKSTKGAVIGGAAGAAAGAATAAATANYNGCVNQGAAIVVKLNTAAQVKV